MSIAPGTLLDIQGVGDPVAVSQHNFEKLTREVFKVVPTEQNGVATTVIGPPTSGAHIEDEFWKDAWNGGWRCTVAGTPGTWRQEEAAVRAGEPSTGTIPTGYVIEDADANFQRKYHAGGYVWQPVGGGGPLSSLTGLTGGGTLNLDGVATTSLALGSLAEFYYNGGLVKYRLRSGTEAESSPYIIRPDDYAASTNEKVWDRVSFEEFPAAVVRDLTGLTGGTSADLNFIPTVNLAVGTFVQFLLSGSYVVYRLRTGTDATASPTVIRPVDFQSVTNAKVWERVLIVAAPGDVLLANNDLNEINTPTKRANARNYIQALGSDEGTGYLNQRPSAGGLFIDRNAGDARVNGATGLALGLNDFSIECIFQTAVSIVSAEILSSHSAGNNRITFGFANTSGHISVSFINSGGSTATYTLVPDIPIVLGRAYHMVLTVDRDGVATLYLNGLSDRDLSGSGVTVSVAASSGVDIGSGNANNWRALDFTGYCYGLRVYNFVLSGAEVSVLARLGSAHYHDQSGNLSLAYTSDFSAGVDGWTANGGSLAGNIDSIGGENDTLRSTASSSQASAYSAVPVTVFGKRFRIKARVYRPSGNTLGVAMKWWGVDLTLGGLFDGEPSTVFSLPADTWTQITHETIHSRATDGIAYQLTQSNGNTTVTNGDLLYLRDITFQQLGCVLDIDVQEALPAQSTTIRDKSSNAYHGTLSTPGIAQAHPRKQLNVSHLTVGASSILSKLISATASLNFGSVSAASSADLTITVTGAAVGDSVALGPASAPTAGIIFWAFVSAADTVTVRATNITGSPIDPGAQTFRATVLQF